MNPYIFGINIILEIFSVYVYDHTFLFSHQTHQKAIHGTLARLSPGATDLKHCMHTQLDFGSNVGSNPPCYTYTH